MPAKIATLSLNLNKKSLSLATALVAEISPEKVKSAGQLFIVLEIEAPKIEAQKISDFLNEEIKHNYYENERLTISETPNQYANSKIEAIFESALVAANKNLLEFLAKEKIKINAKNLNATIGILHNERLYFSTSGRNRTLLLYKETDDKDYRIINVERDEETPNQETTLKKIFASIISGDMPSKSYFIFSNETLGEYLFNQELLGIITKLAPLGAAEQIKNTLTQINVLAPVGGVIIKNTLNSEDFEEIKYIVANSEATPIVTPILINEPALARVEAKTEKILLASGPLSGAKLKHYAGLGLNKLNPLPLLKNVVEKITPVKNQLPAQMPAVGVSPELLTATPEHHSQKLKKILIGALIACVVFFGISLLFKKHEVKQTAIVVAAKNYQQIIEQKENQIEATLLYGNKTEADNLLSELQTTFASLTDTDKKQIVSYPSLEAKFKDLQNKLHPVPLVTNFKELTSPSTNLDDLEILSASSSLKLISADYQNKKVYSFDLKTKATSSASLDNKLGLVQAAFANLKDGFIYYLSANKIVKVNPTDLKNTTLTLDFPNPQNIFGLSMYNEKLYVADKATNQLFKFNSTATSFDKSEARLKDKIDLSKGSALAIDLTGAKSEVYFLSNNGDLKKFYDGKEASFKLGSTTPALSSANKLKVLKNIYVFDTIGKRLIIFDKTGKLIKQIALDTLNNPRDFAIDEDGKQVYIIDSGKIFVGGL